MSPKRPRNARQLRSTAYIRKVVQRVQKGLRRSVPRIAPQFARQVALTVRNGDERAVVLTRKRLPMPIVDRRAPPVAGTGSAPVLMNDYAAKRLNVGRNPNSPFGVHRKFAFNGRFRGKERLFKILLRLVGANRRRRPKREPDACQRGKKYCKPFHFPISFR